MSFSTASGSPNSNAENSTISVDVTSRDLKMLTLFWNSRLGGLARRAES